MQQTTASASLLLKCHNCPVAYAENFHGRVSFSGVWRHLYLVCVVCDVIIMFSKPTFWRSLRWDKIKTVVLDKVNYRGTQSWTCVVWERSAKSGEMVSGCRRQSRFPPKPN